MSSTLESHLSALTWNVSYEPLTPPGVLAWPDRRDEVIRQLQGFEIVALQELSGAQLSDIRDGLPAHEVLTHRVPLPDELRAALQRRYRLESMERDVGELALALRRERLSVQAHGASWLSPSPRVPLSTGWGNETPRLLLWAVARDVVTGATWLLATTHVDLAAVRPMLIAVRDQLAPRIHSVDAAVLLGDLNTMADPGSFAVLLDAGWIDTHGSTALDDDRTFLGDLAGRPGRIDHILITKGAVARDWRRLPDAGGRLSDHLAVATTLDLAV